MVCGPSCSPGNATRMRPRGPDLVLFVGFDAEYHPATSGRSAAKSRKPSDALSLRFYGPCGVCGVSSGARRRAREAQSFPQASQPPREAAVQRRRQPSPMRLARVMPAAFAASAGLAAPEATRGKRRARPRVDGTFTWTAGHDQRLCSSCTVALHAPSSYGCDRCLPATAVHVERPQRGEDNDLDGGQNVGGQLGLLPLAVGVRGVEGRGAMSDVDVRGVRSIGLAGPPGSPLDSPILGRSI